MNLKKRILCVTLAGLLLWQTAWLCACEKPFRRFTAYSFDCFDTVTTVMGYAKDKAEFDRVSGEILAELLEYHKLFTIYEAYDGMENLCSLNEKKTAVLDSRIIDMLLFAKEVYALTGGKVNVAMGSVLSLWHDCRTAAAEDPENARLPSADSLSAAAEHMDMEKLLIDPETCTVTLTDPEMTLDVGAVAKGYALELAARTLESHGITGYLINVGGSARAIGTKPNGDRWTAGIEDPDASGSEYLAAVELQGGSLVTSGSYQRYYTVDDKRYHHIIDPETRMPSDGYSSVSVLCESAALGDALSTALFCMSLEEGMALIDTLDGAEAMWVMSDGGRYESAGFSAREA